jgi:hypothetical protein
MRTPGEFATALFGDPLDDDLRIATWTLRGRRSDWWRAPQALDYLAGRDDTYIGCALTIEAAARTYGHKRMPAEDAVAIGGLWLDVDVNGGPKSNGKTVTDGAATVEEALDLLHHALAPATAFKAGGCSLSDGASPTTPNSTAPLCSLSSGSRCTSGRRASAATSSTASAILRGSCVSPEP